MGNAHALRQTFEITVVSINDQARCYLREFGLMKVHGMSGSMD